MRVLILTALLICLASLVYADEPQQLIDVQHDAHRQVTCWIIPGTGISCLPGSQLSQQRHVGAEAPASTPTPRRDQEVFRL